MSKGRFGIHGGQYIPETLMNAVLELEEAYNHYKNDPEFNRELTELLNEYAGRPSRLYYAAHMTEDLGGAKIYLKREDLNHTGAHKINNVLGQVLLAKKMGKTRVIAETGAGQHGVATATAAALMGMECEIFQSNHEGAIIDKLHSARLVFDAVIINAGAYTHYSYAIRDAIHDIRIPCIEVHISNIHAREEFRNHSVISPVCHGTIAGFGIQSYLLALHAAAAL